MYDTTIYDEPVDTSVVESAPISQVNSLLINQMQHEMINHRTYMNFHGICECKGLLGASKFFKKQADGELQHFQLIFDYCCDRLGFIPELLDIPAIPFDQNKFLADMILDSLNLEIGTTDALVKIKRTAIDVNDFMTDTFLDQFMIEQREEEKTIGDIYNRCMMFGDTPMGIQMLDNELGSIG